MWPLAIVSVIFIFFLEILSGVTLKQEQIQQKRQEIGIAAQFKAYAQLAGAYKKNNSSLPSGVLTSTQMQTEQATQEVNWIQFNSYWCDDSTSCQAQNTAPWWGAVIANGDIYIFRKLSNNDERRTLLGAYSNIQTWISVPDHVGLKCGSFLCDGRGQVIPLRNLPSPASNIIPDHALVQMVS